MTEEAPEPPRDPVPDDPAGPYELDAPPPRPPPPPRADAPARESLLDEFDEDADFDHDPEVAQALGVAVSSDAAAQEAPPPPPEPLVTEGRGSPEIVAGAGGGVSLLAAIIGAASAEGSAFAAAVRTLVIISVYFAVGLAALRTAAHLQGLAASRWALASARMLLAVATFQAIAGIRLPGLGVVNGFIFAPAAAAAYVLVIAALFKWPRSRLVVVTVLHATLALVVRGAFGLYAALSADAA